MSHQESLIFGLRPSLRQAFEVFHKANPGVYRMLCALARDYLGRGERAGIRHLYEVLRWKSRLKPKSNSVYKLNDHHMAYYARLMMEREPDLAGFFSIRELRAL